MAAARLPEATRPGQVWLAVASLDRSLAFYEGVLGFETRPGADGTVLLGAGSAPPLIGLVEQPDALPAARGLLGLYHYAILLPDRGALGRAIAHLAAERVALGAADHLVSEAIYLNDPDGLGIEIYADRPRESWRHVRGELAMSSDPLDMEYLVKAAGGEAWDGMPAGTTIGHVHLHVGDLDAARAFYHEQLGLDIMVSSYPGALFLAAGGYHHHLGVNTWAGARAASPEPRHARLLAWELILPDHADVEAVVERLEAAGNDVALPAESEDPIRRLSAPPAPLVDDARDVRDPWGTIVRVRS